MPTTAYRACYRWNYLLSYWRLPMILIQQSVKVWLAVQHSVNNTASWLLILEYNKKATFSQGDWTSILRYVADPVQDWDLTSMWLVVWRGLNLNWLEISARLFSLVQSCSALGLVCSLSNLVALCLAHRLYILHTLYYIRKAGESLLVAQCSLAVAVGCFFLF